MIPISRRDDRAEEPRAERQDVLLVERAGGRPWRSRRAPRRTRRGRAGASPPPCRPPAALGRLVPRRRPVATGGAGGAQVSGHLVAIEAVAVEALIDVGVVGVEHPQLAEVDLAGEVEARCRGRCRRWPALWTSTPSDSSPATRMTPPRASRSVVTQTFDGTATTPGQCRGRRRDRRPCRLPVEIAEVDREAPDAQLIAVGGDRGGRQRPVLALADPSPNERSAAETTPSGIARASAGAISQRAPPENAATASIDADRDHDAGDDDAVAGGPGPGGGERGHASPTNAPTRSPTVASVPDGATGAGAAREPRRAIRTAAATSSDEEQARAAEEAVPAPERAVEDAPTEGDDADADRRPDGERSRPLGGRRRRPRRPRPAPWARTAPGRRRPARRGRRRRSRSRTRSGRSRGRRRSSGRARRRRPRSCGRGASAAGASASARLRRARVHLGGAVLVAPSEPPESSSMSPQGCSHRLARASIGDDPESPVIGPAPASGGTRSGPRSVRSAARRSPRGRPRRGSP